jgi:hypothetical protein
MSGWTPMAGVGDCWLSEAVSGRQQLGAVHSGAAQLGGHQTLAANANPGQVHSKHHRPRPTAGSSEVTSRPVIRCEVPARTVGGCG